MSYIEIYKEDLRDLLDGSGPLGDLHIREDERGNTGLSPAIQVCPRLKVPSPCMHCMKYINVIDQGSCQI